MEEAVRNTSPQSEFPRYTNSYQKLYTRCYASVDTSRRALTSSYSFLRHRSWEVRKHHKNYQNTSPQSEFPRYTNSYQKLYTRYYTSVDTSRRALNRSYTFLRRRSSVPWRRRNREAQRRRRFHCLSLYRRPHQHQPRAYRHRVRRNSRTSHPPPRRLRRVFVVASTSSPNERTRKRFHYKSLYRRHQKHKRRAYRHRVRRNRRTSHTPPRRSRRVFVVASTSMRILCLNPMHHHLQLSTYQEDRMYRHGKRRAH